VPSHEELKARATAAYDAASDWYDAPDNTFWERFGRRTVERLALEPGMHVLDLCSGSGASAIPAAEAVGRSGRVVASDISERLLALLSRKADGRGLRQIECRVQDLMTLDLDERFDAVVCVFGIFFVADMVAAVERLWTHVAPGGALAITTWGPRLFEPLNTAFWDAVREERADLYQGFNPWDFITDPETLRDLFDRAGVTSVTSVAIVSESATHPLASPESWWALVQGSGYRGTLDQLSASARERVRRSNFECIRSKQIVEVETNVLYAVARKPDGRPDNQPASPARPALPERQ
jgi:ubiquinone/menaquinone biosynthesis C-methylase UbiE